MQRMTFVAFWDAANVALTHRDLPNMLFGEARDAYAVYLDDWRSRNCPDVVDLVEDTYAGLSDAQ